MIIIPQIVVDAEDEDEGREVSVLQAVNEEEIPVEIEREILKKF